MALNLHRCSFVFVKPPTHPCWRVQMALDEAGIAYDVVNEPVLRRGRTELENRTGQRLLPVIEFEDGTILREESKEMVARIKDGRLTGEAASPQ